MPSVVRLLHELCERHAARPALTVLDWDDGAHVYVRGPSTTYASLYEQSLRLADALAAGGVGPGDRVAVLLDNSVELVASEWACLVSSMVWVALNVRSSPDEHAAILADCDPSVVIVSSRYRDRLAAAPLAPHCRVIEVEPSGEWDAVLRSGTPRLPANEPGAEDPVRIRYTSGTAGRPKGAVLPRRCYDASVEVVGDVIGPLAPGDVLAQVAPMTHAAGAMWLPHAVVGAEALLADRFDAHAFVRLLADERVTSAFLVPTMLVRFLEAAANVPKPPALRSIVYGGASMPADRLERGIEKLGPVFVQIYGLTESNWPITALRREDHVVAGSVEDRRRRLSSCGRPTSVGELRIVRADGSEAAANERGEILVRGRNTMLGYWRGGAKADAGSVDRDPGEKDATTGGPATTAGTGSVDRESGKADATADGEATTTDAKGLDADGWMHTGDIAVRDAEGFVTIVDRLHDMIVSGGFNVYPREVEDALSQHPAVLEAAVVGRSDPEWGERVHAVVVLRPGAAAGERELAEHVAARTAGYKKPRSFEFVAELPKNAAGKVLRRNLRRRPENESAPGSKAGGA